MNKELKDHYQVCVIGSGPAGTVVSTTLAKHGIKTILIESGTGLFRWLTDSRMKKLASYEVSGNADYPLTKTKAMLLGGTSNFWTGRTERLHPSDFAQHPYTPVDNPWPITYQELDPHYEWAEGALRVRGYQDNLYAPPRNRPLNPGKQIHRLKGLFKNIGIDVYTTPTATPTKTFQLGRTHQFYNHFRGDGLGSILPVMRQGWILPHHQMKFQNQISRMMRSLFSRFLYIGATIEQKPCPENRVTLSKNRVDCFENPIAHLHLDFTQEDLQLLNKCRSLIRDMYAKLGAHDVYEFR